MRRTLTLLVIAAACGGGKKSSNTPPPTLPPDEAKADPKPEPEEKPAKPDDSAQAAPPEPTPSGPLDAKIAAPQLTVKLVSAGKAPKQALRLSHKAGAKQQVELAFDFAQTATSPDIDNNKPQTTTMPTVVLSGDAEVKAVDKDKTAFELKVTGSDVRDSANAMPPEILTKYKEAVASVQGLVIGSSVTPEGSTGETTLHIDNQKAGTEDAMQVVQFGLPTLPVLPKEPIGVGAKWQVTGAGTVLGQFPVTQTTAYELVAHKGNTWTIKGKTTVTGADQDLKATKVSKITGTGDVDISLVDGVLYPAIKSNVGTSFVLTVSGSDPNQPSAPPKTVVMTIEVKQGSQVTPK